MTHTIQHTRYLLATRADAAPVSVDPPSAPPIALLCCRLAGEEHAIDVSRVLELRYWRRPLVVRSAPPHLRGLVDLRGDTVPVVDLRARFGDAETACHDDTVVVYLSHAERAFGLVVDAMPDVFRFDSVETGPACTRPGPRMGAYRGGIARVRIGGCDRVVDLVDVDALARDLAVDLDTVPTR